MANTPLTYAVPQDRAAHSKIDKALYEEMYARSINDPDGFWAEEAKRLDWDSFPTIIKNTSFYDDVSIKWYEDGSLNACYNCVDRHAEKTPDKTALIWEGDDPQQSDKITYAKLKDEVSRLANALKAKGVQKGDRVILYMPMIPQAVYAMLACARIGAVHSVVFGGFSPSSLRDRIEDCGAKVILTADQGLRGAKTVPLKDNVDAALKKLENSPVETVFVYRYTNADTDWTDGVDIDWQKFVSEQSTDCACEVMNAEDPLFILYTSGSTGKPKGVLHTTGGYLVYAAMTFDLVFDYREGEVYWCTADVGWITGHSYLVYGPLACGATSLVFEGVPSYPDASRFWQVVDKHQVNIFYTAPTAIRALIKEGDSYVTRTDRSSLRILGTVGEPINEEAWHWYYKVVGGERCPIIDTWWQTETGGHLITPLSGATDLKPGKAQMPFFGVKPILVDAEGEVLDGEAEGNLCIADSWPGQMRSLYGDHERFVQTYFSTYKGRYFTSDGAKRDKDGDYRITGRVDDVINVSGHRLGTAEIESAINEHPNVAESAVVGFPHDIKGQGVYAYIITAENKPCDAAVQKEINAKVREIIGPIAKLDKIQPCKGLPKTRSGKIMRRILRKIAAGEFDNLGDTSTLAEPAIVQHLIENRVKD